ncbi:hypothetical protein B5807_04859 [Epicoccum nigrum]|uniref:JmjC domain-containing protein n=1 Tax=Epicoccum nigrum TaxID=105696 RepID=A0A1Y2M2S0_EPING|nr:hypothetical protein B5807_04859 [Epicoccum nigrum]
MSAYLPLHDQDLVDVMVEAERSSSPSARILSDLAERGFAYPLDEKELGPLREKGKVFQRSIWASPVLTDFMSPGTEPDANQIKEILLNDIAGDDPYCFSPSHGSRSEDALAISSLIDNIDNPRYSGPGSVSSLHSPALERFYKYTPSWHQDGILGMSPLTITVTPADNIQDVDFPDSYTHSTLITGSKIWLAFRPTSHNVAVLQAYYNTLLRGTKDLALNHARDYKPAGILFIQRAGETLVLPPFWIATAFSIQPTVSATFQIATAIEFEERIKQLGNFRLTIKQLGDFPLTTQLDHGDDSRAQRALPMFANELIEHLRAVLKDNFQGCYLDKVISHICRDYETLRTDLRRVLEAIEDKAIVRDLENKFRAAWLNFLELKRQMKPLCRLCKLRIKDMPAGASPTDRLRQHFINLHCLRSDRSTDRIAQQ